uniref:Oxoglutarate/iron-dependent oxygenase C-terminal degradation domain-containing protein n=1 Tax=Tetranychus urticae TaxID=32264 RepID=T1KT25_TETUR
MSPDIDPIPGTSKSQDAPVKVVKKERPTSWLKDKRLDPRATIIIRRWQPGSYSLATDDEDVLAPQGVLDVHFAFDHVAGTCQTHGGYISYVNKETGEEFYRCTPQENVLHLVWLPPSEYRFIKYHNVLAEHVYYDINVIYKE